jgi:large subunit ribosomal protein L25
MSETILKAVKRDKTGKGATRKYRADGWIPAEYYSSHDDNFHLLLKGSDFESILAHGHGLFKLEIEGEKKEFQCVIKELQLEPILGQVLHADFFGVKSGEKLILNVPISLQGTAAGVKTGGIMEFLIRELEVECLPRHIPEVLEIDVSQLEVGDSIRIKDLMFENIRILDDPNETIVLVEHSKLAKEIEEMEESMEAELEEEESQEPEVITARKSDEDEEEEEKEKEKEKE